MANYSRINGKMDRQELGWATTAIKLYILGGKPSQAEMIAAQKFLDVLPKGQVAKLDELSTRSGESARQDLIQFMTNIAESNPAARTKLLDVIDAGDLQLIAAQSAPKELAVQQQQAYLKLVGLDIGKAGLDGIAGKDSKTQKALDEFAKQNGIDPKDTAKVNQVLFATAVSLQSKSSLEAMQRNIKAGNASPDDIKAVQWVLKGMNEKMPLSLHGDKMDGVAGVETKTLLKASIAGVGNSNNGLSIKAPQSIAGADGPLEHFTNSLSQEQRAIQRQIAALGGSQARREVLEMEPNSAARYFHRKEVDANIYDGGFPLGINAYGHSTYTPSDEVHRLQEEFDKSLTLEQKVWRQAYEDKQSTRETGLKSVPMLVDPNWEKTYLISRGLQQTPLDLFKDNKRDLVADSLTNTTDVKADIAAKSLQSSGYTDVLGKRGIQGIDVTGAFGNAAQGSSLSAMLGLDDEFSKQIINTRVVSPVVSSFKP